MEGRKKEITAFAWRGKDTKVVSAHWRISEAEEEGIPERELNHFLDL